MAIHKISHIYYLSKDLSGKEKSVVEKFEPKTKTKNQKLKVLTKLGCG